jgi:hypothetical protein
LQRLKFYGEIAPVVICSILELQRGSERGLSKGTAKAQSSDVQSRYTWDVTDRALQKSTAWKTIDVDFMLWSSNMPLDVVVSLGRSCM